MSEKKTALEAAPPKKKKSFLKRLQHYIVTTILGGIAIVLPITLLFVSIRFLWNQIKRLTQPLKNLVELSDEIAGWVFDLTAFAVMLFAFFLLGLVIQTNLGREFWAFIENQLLSRVPFYMVLRDTVRQFFGKGDKMPFTQVVEVDVFNNGTRMIGFISEEMSDGRYSVFVPTGPNPTNGFIFLVNREQLRFVQMRPEEAMRTVVGVGTGAGDHFSLKK